MIMGIRDWDQSSIVTLKAGELADLKRLNIK